MFPLFLAIAGVGALVGFAIKKVSGPATKPQDERFRMEKLKMKKFLSLDEAEDGLVLARRYGDKGAEVRFRFEVGKLRAKRPLI